ncbi:MAG: cupin domain-containing protein [Deltaproteobacteria bacterium]|nr:cupin domain-containing protein [Deltaproteobacteria bacterium]
MQKKQPVLIKPEEGKRLTGALGGYGRRMLNHTHSNKLCMGILYVDPGKSPHRWHSHEERDSNEGFVVTYPEGFEEAYFIVQGKGVLQWRENGELREKRVETGDVIHFPPDVYEHQLLNDQETPMTVVYATAPPVV